MDIFENVLNNNEAAEYLTENGYKISPSGLSVMTNQGNGPRFERCGNKFYRKEWLDEFLAQDREDRKDRLIASDNDLRIRSMDGVEDGTRKILTVFDVASLFGVQPNTVRNWIRDGKLPAEKVHKNMYLIHREAINELWEKKYGNCDLLKEKWDV